MTRNFWGRLCMHDRGLALLILVAIVLGIFYNGAILPGYAPDEPRHFAYLKLLWEGHRLPQLLPDGSEVGGAHSLHPPLYYLLLLPLYVIAKGLGDNTTYHIVRLGSLLLCVAALPLIYRIAWLATSNWPEAKRRTVARLSVAGIALLPMWGMSAGSINNDGATLFFVALLVWALAARFRERHDWRSALVIGVLLALCGWCKFNAFASGVVALVAFYIARDGLRAFVSPRAWGHFVLAFGTGVVLLLPWLAHNMRLYGTPVLLPPRMGTPTGGDPMMMFAPDFPSYAAQAAWGIFCTLWSQKDWFPEAIRTPIYILLAAICALAVSGWFMFRRARTTLSEPQIPDETAGRIARWSSYWALAANFGAVWQGALFLTWGWAEGGRYLLPSLFGGSLALALGWSALFSNRLRVFERAWYAFLLILNGIALYWLIAYLNPTFGPK